MGASPSDVVSQVREAAEKLIESLDANQKEQQLFDFNDGEQRHR